VSNQRLSELVRLVIELTKNGKIGWKPTSTDDEFQASFVKYSVRIFESMDEDGRETSYGLKIFNEKGQLLEVIWPYDVRSESDLTEYSFRETFVAARRSALKVDEAVENFITELNRVKGGTSG
jgi:hypothetical protein